MFSRVFQIQMRNEVVQGLYENFHVKEPRTTLDLFEPEKQQTLPDATVRNPGVGSRKVFQETKGGNITRRHTLYNPEKGTKKCISTKKEVQSKLCLLRFAFCHLKKRLPSLGDMPGMAPFTETGQNSQAMVYKRLKDNFAKNFSGAQRKGIIDLFTEAENRKNFSGHSMENCSACDATLVPGCYRVLEKTKKGEKENSAALTVVSHQLRTQKDREHFLSVAVLLRYGVRISQSVYSLINRMLFLSKGTSSTHRRYQRVMMGRKKIPSDLVVAELDRQYPDALRASEVNWTLVAKAVSETMGIMEYNVPTNAGMRVKQVLENNALFKESKPMYFSGLPYYKCCPNGDDEVKGCVEIPHALDEPFSFTASCLMCNAVVVENSNAVGIWDATSRDVERLFPFATAEEVYEELRTTLCDRVKIRIPMGKRTLI